MVAPDQTSIGQILPPQNAGQSITVQQRLANALATDWSLPKYKAIVDHEAGEHGQRIADLQRMFEQAGAAFSDGGNQLSEQAQALGEHWGGTNYHKDFAIPVTEYGNRLRGIGAGLAENPHITYLADLQTMAIPNAKNGIQGPFDSFTTSMERLRQIAAAGLTVVGAGRGPGLVQEADEINQLVDTIEASEASGFQVISALSNSYSAAAKAVQSALNDIPPLDGPRAGQAPAVEGVTPAGPGGLDGGGGMPAGGAGGMPAGGAGGMPAGGAGGMPAGGAGGAPAGGAGGAPAGGAGGAPAGGAGGTGMPTGSEPPADMGIPPDTSGDTGLAGMPSTTAPTLPPSTVPDLPAASSSSPSLAGSTPVGGIGGVGTSGSGSSTGNQPIQQAARNLTTPSTGPAGSAPSLAGTTAGAAAKAPGGAGMPMIPPMVPPMGAGAGGAGNKPGSGAAPPLGTGKRRPAGHNAGVPSGLLGRRGDVGTYAAPEPKRRVRENAAQEPELLDSELWQPDQSSTATSHTAPTQHHRRAGRA